MFNELEIQHNNSAGTPVNKKVPCKFSSREKSTIFSEQDSKRIRSGNYNVLPRSSLVLEGMALDEERITNKNTKHIVSRRDNLDYIYNGVPYNFTYGLIIQVRGMNEATMIIEQVASKFNPNYYIDLNELPGTTEPTRIQVQLEDISLETEEYEELSSNIVTINIGFNVRGYIYPPLKSVASIKEVRMSVGFQEDLMKDVLYNWDVTSGQLQNEQRIDVSLTSGNLSPVINDIIGTVDIGINDLTLDYTDYDNIYDELIFAWNIESGSASITSGSDNVQMTVMALPVTVNVTVTDLQGHSDTFQKTFS
jgi:hypothetical protein